MAQNITYPFTTHYVQLPGNCNIAYIDEGTGPQTLLFIHGLANYALVWQKNIAELKKYYRCIAIDLPGNGLSDQNPHPFSMQFFADCIKLFIDDLGLRNVCLVGHSMGGQVAMTALLQYPGCAQKVVLCAPAGLEKFSALEKAMYFTAIHMADFVSSEEHSLRHTIENSFYRNHSQAESVVSELVALMRTYKMNYYRRMVESCIKAMLDEPVFDRLHELTIPALVIYGRHDAFIPNRLIHHTTTEHLASEAVKRMPDARLVLLPDCGHFVQWENAQEVNRQVMMFVQ